MTIAGRPWRWRAVVHRRLLVLCGTATGAVRRPCTARRCRPRRPARGSAARPRCCRPCTRTTGRSARSASVTNRRLRPRRKRRGKQHSRRSSCSTRVPSSCSRTSIWSPSAPTNRSPRQAGKRSPVSKAIADGAIDGVHWNRGCAIPDFGCLGCPYAVVPAAGDHWPASGRRAGKPAPGVFQPLAEDH